VTGYVSYPVTSAFVLTAVDWGFLEFMAIIIVILILLALISGIVHGAQRAIFNATFRFVRRAEGSTKRYVRRVDDEPKHSYVKEWRYVKEDE